MDVDVGVEAVIPYPREVVAFSAGDPSNAPQWYANIVSVTWQTPPPVAVGSRMDFEARFLGRRLTHTYEVVGSCHATSASSPSQGCAARAAMHGLSHPGAARRFRSCNRPRRPRCTVT